MRKYCRVFMGISLLSIFFTIDVPPVYSNSFQRFGALGYENPAALGLIKKYQIILGNLYYHGTIDFNGQVFRQNGQTSGLISQNAPFGRVAMRLSPVFVAGVDISQPFGTHVTFPSDSLVAPTAFQTIVNNYDISPKMALNLTPDLSVGFGLNVNYLSIDITQNLPIRGSQFLYQNTGSDWDMGWDMGILYKLTKATFVGLSYYSRIDHQLRDGVSSITNPRISPTSPNADISLPPVTSLSITQYLSPKWSIRGSFNYIQWRVLNKVTLSNTAIPTPPFVFNFHDSVRAGLGTQYDLTKKWGVRLGFIYDQTPGISDFRGVSIPNENAYIAAAGLHYQIFENVGLDVDYGHAFIPRSSITNRVIQTFGDADLATDSIIGKITVGI